VTTLNWSETIKERYKDDLINCCEQQVSINFLMLT